MADEDRSLKLGVDVDESSINRAKARLAEIEKAQQEVHAEFLKGAKSADIYTKELAALDKEAALLNKSLDALEEPRKIKVDTQQLDRAAQTDFADRSGDKASIAGMTRGAVDALTGGNAGALGQVLEGAEAVFDLGEAAGKLGGPVGKAVSSLGPAGLAGVAGVAGAALVAINIGLAIWAKEAQKAREVQSAYTESLKETIRALEEGATSGDVNERRQELEREIQIAQRQADALKEVREERNAENNAIEDLFNASRVLTGGTRKQLNEDITAADNAVRSAEAALEAFEHTLDDSELAANDAAAAEKALAEARTASLLTEAAQAGELEALKLRAVDLTQEQIDAELKALQIREASIKAELSALESSGDTSEEVAAKIAQLREQLGFLGEQADVLKTARPKARSEAAEKRAEEAKQEREKAAQEAEREREKQAQEAQRAADEARRAQEQYTEAVANAKQGFADATEDIKQGLIDSATDINQDLQDNLNEQSIEFQQNELKEERQYRRDLAQISRDAQRSELEATRQRDFAAARDAREQAAEAKADRIEDERTTNEEQLLEFKQAQDALGRERDKALRDAQLDSERQLRDAAIARDRSIRDAQAGFEQRAQLENNFQQNSLKQWDGFFKQITAMQTQAFGSTSRSTTSRTNTSSRQSSTGLNELQLVLSNR